MDPPWLTVTLGVKENYWNDQFLIIIIIIIIVITTTTTTTTTTLIIIIIGKNDGRMYLNLSKTN